VVVTGDGVDGSDLPEWALRFSVAYTITVPSLRRRREDIPVLFSTLASGLSEAVRPAPELAPETLRALLAYSWPGNTRQLSAVVRHAVLSATGPTLRLADLPGWLHGKHPRRSLSTREQLEFDAIVEALQATEGNRVHAANRLGMARSTLYRKLAAYGIDPDDFAAVMAPVQESASDTPTDERRYEVA
jgi:DNA-binding NtrC family response regulator